jgi:hypothetical protein
LTAKGAPLSKLSRQLYKKLLVIGEVYRQQKEMYDSKTNRCDGRIVSISQPHIRPIVRGKEHAPTEFGSKVAIGLVGGYVFIFVPNLLPYIIYDFQEISLVLVENYPLAC